MADMGVLTCCLDRLLNTCQKWLEGPDKPATRLAAWAVLITCTVYITAQVVLMMCRGG